MTANDYQLYWGETHDNTYQFEPQLLPIEETLTRAASHLDFYTAAYYTSRADAFRAGGHPSEVGADEAAGEDRRRNILLEEWKHPERLAAEWAEVQDATRRLNEPGRFVCFPGYEWQGDASGGDHNVFFLSEDNAPIVRVGTISELYAGLRGLDALAIPHHIGYLGGMRGRDWSVVGETRRPFCEILSVHGCSETDEEWLGLRINSHMGPGIGATTYAAALDRGWHLGCVCSTDNWGDMPGHYGNGRAGCYARELSREGLWEAFKARRVYGVTGDQIRLNFRVNDAWMGERISATGKRRIEVSVVGVDALDRIEILRNNEVIHTHCHQGSWQPPAPGESSAWKMRVEPGWGPRPHELVIPNRQWQGELRVDGRFIGVDRCWVSPGQGQPVLDGDRAAFSIVSQPGNVSGRWQNSNVFEFTATPEAALSIDLNGLTEHGTVGDFAAQSRLLWYRDECVQMLADEADIVPDSPARNDVYFHMAYKAKIHRVIPAAGYCASVAIDDDKPFAGEIHYRVRVEQRNGQRAWSSPIWVQ